MTTAILKRPFSLKLKIYWLKKHKMKLRNVLKITVTVTQHIEMSDRTAKTWKKIIT